MKKFSLLEEEIKPKYEVKDSLRNEIYSILEDTLSIKISNEESLDKDIDINGKEELVEKIKSLIDDVNKHVREYANKIQENTAYKIQEIEENNADLEQLTNLSHVDNVYLTEKRRDALIQMAKGDKEKAIKVALKLGYKIPDRDVYASQK